MQIFNCHCWESNPNSSKCESGSIPTEPLVSKKLAGNLTATAVQVFSEMATAIQ